MPSPPAHAHDLIKRIEELQAPPDQWRRNLWLRMDSRHVDSRQVHTTAFSCSLDGPDAEEWHIKDCSWQDLCARTADYRANDIIISKKFVATEYSEPQEHVVATIPHTSDSQMAQAFRNNVGCVWLPTANGQESYRVVRYTGPTDADPTATRAAARGAFFTTIPALDIATACAFPPTYRYTSWPGNKVAQKDAVQTVMAAHNAASALGSVTPGIRINGFYGGSVLRQDRQITI